MENKTQLSTEHLELQNIARDKRNKKIFIYSAIGIGVVGVVLAIVFTVRHFGSKAQDEAIGKADIAYLTANDSVSQAKAMEQYKAVADAGSYDANERAQLYVAADFYQKGKYKEALEYLDKPSVSSDIIEAAIYSLKGDCHVNLKEYDEAFENYDEAIESADNNPVLTPFILKKKANLYHEQKKYGEEFECYETIRRDFPGAIPEVEKYYERAKKLAGK